MITYSVLQHYYDKGCIPESWSSLLTSLLAENNKGACWKTQTLVLKDVELAKCKVVSSYTDTKTRSETVACNSFSCFIIQTNSRFWVICRCSALCFSVGTCEDATKHSAIVSSFETRIYWVFLLNCVETPFMKRIMLRCFQLAVTSAMSSSSQDCDGCHNVVDHYIWS